MNLAMVRQSCLADRESHYLKDSYPHGNEI
jgi:hypothetical protein